MTVPVATTYGHGLPRGWYLRAHPGLGGDSEGPKLNLNFNLPS